MRGLLLTALVFGATAKPAANLDEVYARPQRVQYIAEALTALRSAKPAKVEDAARYLALMERTACKSSFRRLRAECLLSAARRNCKGAGGKTARASCETYSDLAVVNLLSEPAFVSAARRYDIMKAEKDFRRGLRRELWRRYGDLASDFAITTGASCSDQDVTCLSEGIDAFCMDHGGPRQLAWQHCAAALTWFIGNASVATPGP